MTRLQNAVVEEGAENDKLPSIDFSMASNFLGILGDCNFTFQTFSDKKSNGHHPQILHGSFDENKESLVSLNKRGAGVFVTVNETDGKGRKTENITRVRALFIDLDGAPLQPVKDAIVKPHIIIESSRGRYHAYWLVNDCPLGNFNILQKGLAAKFDSDPKVCDLPRVMRLPGFIHNKHNAFTTQIIELSSDLLPYTVDNLVEQLKLTYYPLDKPVHDSPVCINGGFVEGGRNSGIFDYARKLRIRALDESEIKLLVLEKAKKCCPPLDEVEALRCLESSKNYI